MFVSLLVKECKIWMKSILFYVYIIILFLFYVTQMGSETVVNKPEPEQDYYGTTFSSDKNAIMNGTLKVLLSEYYCESYSTYPLGFYKQVILSDSENEKIKDCISKLTEMTDENWKETLDEYYAGIVYEEDENGRIFQKETVEWPCIVSNSIDDQEFLEIMKQVEDIIGKGSSYSEEKLKQNGIVALTYEQALAEYDDILLKDKVTGAYARLFCDYMGIFLAILPAFFGVTRVLKDKKSMVSGVVYSKRSSSISIVLSRYLGMVIILFVPVLIISCFSLTQSVYTANAISVGPNYMAYIKYSFGWLLPEIFFVTGLSYFITELTESLLAILINTFIWFCAVFMGGPLKRAGWNLIPRFNILGEYSTFESMLPQLIRNRLLYTGISVLLVLLIIIVFEAKRKGGYEIREKISKNSQC